MGRSVRHCLLHLHKLALQLATGQLRVFGGQGHVARLHILHVVKAQVVVQLLQLPRSVALAQEHRHFRQHALHVVLHVLVRIKVDVRTALRQFIKLVDVVIVRAVDEVAIEKSLQIVMEIAHISVDALVVVVV